MQEAELIAQQAMKIADLEVQLGYYKIHSDKIHLILFGIGGPLNDSRVAYTKEQLAPFFDIARHID